MANKKIKVILLEDVPKTGRKYEVEEVAMGYFRNYLLPNELAEPATEEVLSSLKEKREKAEAKRNEKRKEYKKQASKLEGTTLTFEERVSDENHLYGSVSASDIEERLEEKGFSDVAAKLSEPIREVGGKEVAIDFGLDVITTINIDVTPQQNKKASEEESPEEEEPEEKEEE